MATMEASESLRPDVPVTKSGPLSSPGGGSPPTSTKDAVTAADLWLYDEKTGVAVIGDLVTLPAPFFETACPARLGGSARRGVGDAVPRRRPWTRRADVRATPLQPTARPSAAFRACVGGDGAPAMCATAWTRDVGPLLADEDDRQQAIEYATYYVDFLRKNGGASPDCRAK